MTIAMHDSVEQVLASHIPDDARAWFQGALDKAEGAWQAPFAMVDRKLPRGAPSLNDAQREALGDRQWLFEDSSFVELGRVTVLLRMGMHSSGQRVSETLTECFRRGDNAEKRAVLRSLALMPAPQELVDLAVNGCRTNVTTVFEGISCSNPYPAKHFPEPNFNQLVLKALFIGVALERIMSIRDRLNEDLARMARDYADEREAAGRSLPPDIELVM